MTIRDLYNSIIAARNESVHPPIELLDCLWDYYLEQKRFVFVDTLLGMGDRHNVSFWTLLRLMSLLIDSLPDDKDQLEALAEELKLANRCELLAAVFPLVDDYEILLDIPLKYR